ncbi:unnamed protein product [Thelazia callipaeda]|uniref:Fork-head domain-containing protein n=1 Tax=Thelazia callipaeda TaxID=103827 RepID=A0A0N5CSS2_THECL|nr:unnamed protein product [Thelazia callipaeda]
MSSSVTNTTGEDSEEESCVMQNESKKEYHNDDLTSLNWLVGYKLPDYFTLADNSCHQHVSANASCSSNSSHISEDVLFSQNRDELLEEKLSDASSDKISTSKCSILCLIYRVLATSSNRRLSLSDISRRFAVLHSFWSINPEFAKKYQHVALAEGFAHRCPSAPFLSERSDVIEDSKTSDTEL